MSSSRKAARKTVRKGRGSRSKAAWWSKLGIKPQKRKPHHTVCSIGFSARLQRWYGWSHRAYAGFGIGDVIKPGDVAYRRWRGRETIKTLAQARAAAERYAEAVS